MNRDDSRIRKVPMFFGRPNLTEMNRVYRELVTVTLGPAESQPIPEEILAPVEMASPAIHKTEEATNSPVEASEQRSLPLSQHRLRMRLISSLSSGRVYIHEM